MKKIIAFCLSAMLMLSMSATAFAAELNGMGTEASSTINYIVDSSYCVNIPETIDANEEYTFTASMVNIQSNQQVKVNCKSLANGGYITMANSDGDSFDLTFSGMQGEMCVAQFLKGNLTSTFAVMGIPANEAIPMAGEYTGIAEFVLELAPYNP